MNRAILLRGQLNKRLYSLCTDPLARARDLKFCIVYV
jgi:hypothetical protein